MQHAVGLALVMLAFGTLVSAPADAAVTPPGTFCDGDPGFRIRYDHGYFAHRFIDISADPAALQPILADGDYVDLDFGTMYGMSPGSVYFTFFNVSYTQMRVYDNGFIRFHSGGPSGLPTTTPQDLPNEGEPNGIAAALWEDYIPGLGGGRVHAAHVTSPVDALVVQWTSMHVDPNAGNPDSPWSTSGPGSTFQMLLFNNNSIEVNWKSTENHQVEGTGTEVTYGGVSGIESQDPDGPGPLATIAVQVAGMADQTAWDSVSYRYTRVPEKQPSPFPDGDADLDGAVEDIRYRVSHGQSKSIDAPGVIANDFDDNACVDKTAVPAGIAPAGLTCPTTMPPTPGLCADGSWLYEPPACASPGKVFLTYQVDDGLFVSAGSAQITWEIMNQAPVAVDDPSGVIKYEVPEDKPLKVILSEGLLVNDLDGDGDSLTAALVDLPDKGSVTLLGTGEFDYAPDPDANGPDFFTYTADDCVQTSGEAEVRIDILPVNDPPVFTAGGAVAADQDGGFQSVAAWATAISPGPADESGQSVTFVTDSVSDPAMFTPGGQPAILPNGDLVFTPAAEATGTATVVVHARDDGGNNLGGTPDGPPVTFTITLQDVNDAPTFRLQATRLDVLEDAGPQSEPFWAYDIDPGAPSESGQSVSFTVNYTNSGLFLVPPTVSPSGTLEFQTAKDQVGTSTLTLRAVDDGVGTKPGDDTSDPKAMLLVVGAVNDPPSFTILGDVQATEDQGLALFPLWATAIKAGPPDEAGQELAFDVTAARPELFDVPPAVSADGALSFSTKANMTGNTTVDVFLVDDGGDDHPDKDTSPTKTFTVSLKPVNDAPSFAKGADVTVLEDSGAFTLGWATAVSAGPSDETGQDVRFEVTTDRPGLFAVQPQVQGDGILTFTPAPDAFGVAEIQVSAVDDGGQGGGGVDRSPPAKAVVRIDPVEDAPRVEDVHAEVLQRSDASDPGQVIMLAGTDPDGDPITYEIVKAPDASKGSLAPAGSGAAREYRPVPYFIGTDTFTYRVTDTKAWSEEATVFLTVTDRNDPPTFTIAQDPVTVAEDAATRTLHSFIVGVSPGVDESDSQSVVLEAVTDDPDAFAVGPTLVQGATNASLVLRPAPDFHGEVAVRVVAKDYGGAADAAPREVIKTFLVRVTPGEDMPSAVSFSVDAVEDLVFEGRDAGTVLRGSDIDGDVLSFVLEDDAEHGTVTLEGAGQWRYAPDPDFHGEDRFTYRATDGTLLSPPATVTLDVAPRNDAPVAIPQTFVLQRNTTDNLLHVINGTSGATTWDVDGDVPVLDRFDPPAVGTAVATTDGQGLRYSPPRDFEGAVQFTYYVQDASGATSGPATITIAIGPQDPAVTFKTTQVGRTVTFSSLTLPGTDPVVETTWTFSDGVALPGSMTVRDFPQYGTYQVRLSLRYADGHAAYAQRSLHVVDLPPSAQDDTFGFREGLGSMVLDVLANDGDPGNDPLKVSGVGEPRSPTGAVVGSLQVVDGGRRLLLVLDDADHEGTVEFDYTVSDGVFTDAAHVTVAVQDPDDAPIVFIRQVGDEACMGQKVSFQADPHFQPVDATSYEWRITAGQTTQTVTTTLPLLTHTFTAPGQHLVQVTGLWKPSGADVTASSQPLPVHVEHCKLPLVAFSAEVENLTVSFQDKSTSEIGGVVSRAWDFGDGKASTTAAPVHVYADSGEFVVGLTVTNDEGRSQTLSKAVKVISPADAAKAATKAKEEAAKKAAEAPPPENRPPAADAGPDLTVRAGHVVSLDASDSTDPDGDPVTYRWIQVSGPPVALKGADAPTVTFVAAEADGADAVWTFKLVVSDGSLQASDTVQVTVPYDAPPTLSLDHEPVDNATDAFRFVATADGAGADGLRYTWDFGDGSPEIEGEEVQHRFEEGAYTVKLTVRDEEGETVMERTLLVTALPPAEPAAKPAAKAGLADLISSGYGIAAVALLAIAALGVVVLAVLLRRKASAAAPRASTGAPRRAAQPGSRRPERPGPTARSAEASSDR